MGYANQFIGGGDGATRRGGSRRPGRPGVIVADLTPDEGGPFERVAGEHGLAVVYLVAPTTPPDASRRDRRAQRRLPLLRVARRRHRRSRLAAADASAASSATSWPPRRSRSAVGFGVSRPAHVRALAKAGAGGVIVASALVDALGHDGRDVDRMAALVRAARRRDRAPRVKVDVAIEAGQKKAFATAVDWPGWSRSGKTEDAAVESLIAYAERYAPIADRRPATAFDPDRSRSTSSSACRAAAGPTSASRTRSRSRIGGR